MRLFPLDWRALFRRWFVVVDDDLHVDAETMSRAATACREQSRARRKLEALGLGQDVQAGAAHRAEQAVRDVLSVRPPRKV